MNLQADFQFHIKVYLLGVFFLKCACERVYLHAGSHGGSVAPKATVISSCGPSDAGAGDRTQVFFKNRKCSYLVGPSSHPCQGTVRVLIVLLCCKHAYPKPVLGCHSPLASLEGKHHRPSPAGRTTLLLKFSFVLTLPHQNLASNRSGRRRLFLDGQGGLLWNLAS